MAVEAEALLIRPFRDVIALGNAALTNASTHVPPQAPGSADHVDRMTRAAQALVREGERALSKVQVVWNDQVEKYGDGFRNTMVQQASIEKRRLNLEDLLWDFDDVTQVGEFDQGRYTALQFATKALALDIVETGKRLKFERILPPMPPGGFPPLPPLPSRPTSRAGLTPGLPSPRLVPARLRALSDCDPSRDDSLQFKPANYDEVGYSSHGSRHRLWSSTDTTGSLVDTMGKATPTIDAKHLGKRRSLSAHPPSEARHVVPVHRGALTPPASPGTAPTILGASTVAVHPPICSPTSAAALSPSNSRTRMSVISDTSSSSSAALGSLDSLTIAEDVAEPDYAISIAASTHPPSSSRTERTTVSGDSLMDMGELLREARTNSDWRKSRSANPREPDCAIREGSTYYKLKGLCKGATRFRKDGHWGSIKLTNEFDCGAGGAGAAAADMMRASDGITVPFQYETTKVGSCSDCGYSHDLDDVEPDKSNQPGAVRASASGARYRIRLLFKSHLRQGNSVDAFYACLWCVQAGVTTREGDATAFRSAEDLLRHITRHPQPLPGLPGITVAYGRLADDDPQIFDLHLPDTPAPVPMPENVARLPTAVAVKDHYRRPGRGKLDKPPRYDGEMLEFLEGARIVGVIFPEKWGGKYCLGRHDGEFGAFPAKAIELRSPQESEIPVGGENGMSVTTRWKWQPAGAADTPWLSFGKGEVLTNVQCLYADYWCWSGTNAKGKTGVFPQSHIDLQTLRTQDMRASKKPSKTRGLFGSRS